MSPSKTAKVDSFIDPYGCLDKLSSPDGGDSCQRQAMYVALMAMMSWEDREKFYPTTMAMASLKAFHPSPGVIIRHPKPSYWASDWDRGSTDQVRPWLIACALTDKKELKSYFLAHLKRGFLTFTNTRRNGATKDNHGEIFSGKKFRDYRWKLPDLVAPDTWGIYIRGLSAWPLYWLLWVIDVWVFLGACLERIFKLSNSDILNQTLIILYGERKYPTLWIWLARLVHPDRVTLEKFSHYFRRKDDLQFFVEMVKCSMKKGPFEAPLPEKLDF